LNSGASALVGVGVVGVGGAGGSTNDCLVCFSLIFITSI